MTIDLTQLLASCIAAGIGAFGAYVAIRTDLADLKARMTNVEDATKVAHSRIDKVLHKE
jgi:hypothetical protein